MHADRIADFVAVRDRVGRLGIAEEVAGHGHLAVERPDRDLAAGQTRAIAVVGGEVGREIVIAGAGGGRPGADFLEHRSEDDEAVVNRRNEFLGHVLARAVAGGRNDFAIRARGTRVEAVAGGGQAGTDSTPVNPSLPGVWSCVMVLLMRW